jgi:hypothetical protein
MGGLAVQGIPCLPEVPLMSETAAVPAQPSPGLFARAIGMITSPRATYEQIVKNPKPVGILFLVALVIAIAAALPQSTETGRQAALDQQVKQTERFTGRPVNDQQYARMESMSKYGPVFALVGAFVTLPIFSLIFAGIFFVAFNVVLGGTASFKQVLAVVTHSQVIGALGALLGAPIQMLKGTVTMSGPFNLGALAPFLEEGSKPATFLGMISVFMIWGTIVNAIGLGVLYRRNSRTIAIVLLALWFLFFGVITMLFSGAASAG